MNELTSSSIPFALPEVIKRNPYKRSFDILFSLFALILLLPLMFFIVVLVRCTSKGKSVYKHPRIGRNGKSFHCYKFRTMYPDADARLKELLAMHPELRDEWVSSHKLKNDPRVTPFGKFLRKCSLDELPQFWNVLRGDMSVVGPRPVVLAEVIAHLGPKSSKILSVRPGLTCLWQVSGRSDTSYERRVALDEKYVDEPSFWLDLKLIALTIPRMFFSSGAY